MGGLDSLRDLNIYSIILRVFLALIMGGVLGVERGKKNHPAGFRTHMLVCLGATLVMMTNQYVFQRFQTSDPVRMGAQVISGIGFLGAGTILVTGRNQIRGITTAAGLWASACCGLAIGIGFYEGALVGGVLIIFVMSALNMANDMIRRNSKIIEVYVEFRGKKTFSSFITYAREHQMEVTNIQMNKNKYAKDVDICAVITLESQVKRPHQEMMMILTQAEGVTYVEEMS